MARLGRRQPFHAKYGLPQWVRYPSGADVSKNLTGQSITVGQGSLPALSIAYSLMGQVIPVNQGSLTSQGDVVFTLTGQAIILYQGSLTGPVSVKPQVVTFSGGGRKFRFRGGGRS